MSKSDQGVSTDRYRIIPRTLIFITKQDQILLIKGSPEKRLWANKFNGIGGHIERGEDVFTAANRELKEETGLENVQLYLCGTVIIDASDEVGIGLYVLRGEYVSGDLIESQEGALEWLPIRELDTYPLVEDLHILLPHVFASGEAAPPFSARYFYDEMDDLQIQFGYSLLTG